MVTRFGLPGTNFRAGAKAEPPAAADAETIASLSTRLDAAAQVRLGRSLAIRHVNTGSCNGCELELRALTNVVYELERFGLRFVDSPRHADVLLVTGPLTRTLRATLEQARLAAPDPKWIVAVGDCAVDGGVFKGSYAVLGGAGLAVPVDLTIGGCPPSPARILAGLRSLLEANAARKG
ncbi:NADH-quinone oxidoreductase subunit B family protein [Rhodopila sp.]|uniref:NADH-quinone oxidoreductase subunit B family protein n=1 Tax=Rhodopila sp. TaxID=2480087 RepID=UPI003D0AAF02